LFEEDAQLQTIRRRPVVAVASHPLGCAGADAVGSGVAEEGHEDVEAQTYVEIAKRQKMRLHYSETMKLRIE
jgi:hypothetical protein